MQISSIRWRLVTIFVLLVIITMMISGTLIVYLTRNNEYKAIENDLIRLSSLYNQISIGNEEDAETLEKIYKDVLIQNTINLPFSDSVVCMINLEGEVIYTTSSELEIAKRILTPQTIAASNGESLSELDRVSNLSNNDRLMGLALPIKDKNNEVAFILYFLKGTSQVEEGIKRTVYVISISILIATFLAIILGYLFSDYLTDPIRLLTTQAQDMAHGNLNNLIPVTSDDEIGSLTINFNYMAYSLKLTLDEIATEKNKMETIINYMTDGILVFDEFGNLIHKNLASVRMLAVPNAHNFEQIFMPKLHINFKEMLDKIDQEGQKKFIIENNRQFYNLVFARHYADSTAFKGIICVIQDVTEDKKIEQIQKEFVANVSHELRTPITTIKSYVETLLELSPEDIQHREHFLNVIDSESDRMIALIQDLLELSKIDNKQLSFKMERFDFSTFVQNEVERYQIHANRKNQKIYFDSADNYYIYGDIDRVGQVFRNLFSNAIKYSPEGSDINISLYEDENYIITKIQDFGIGISEEDLPRIFERFYRVDKARSRAMGGTGLGLAIVNEIVSYHRGKIEVDSKYGEGTTFFLYFPKL